MASASSAIEPRELGILVADQSPDIRAMVMPAIRETLPTARIHEAKSGPEALALLRSQKIDAVIMDVTMPQMSGPDVVTEARRDGKRPFLILTSAVVLPNWGMLCTELQAYEFLKKPFSQEDVQNLLGNFARMSKPTRVLIADAGDQTRAMVRKVVSASRFAMDIHETDNGGHAIKLARMKPFDLVLMDSNLNGISGLEAACQMQNLHPETTVVSILPSNDGGLGQSLKHLGLTHFLRKPFFTRDIDLMLHVAHNLRRPYLMNAVMKAAQTALAS
ncbi:MAG: response regulator [Beijerinckiaceae bacterium]|jgi:CheY-like chemotaxis protein|nr:response regulator [Beijerinckiaceae bacterium]